MISKIAVIEPVGGHGGMDYYDFGLCRGLVYAGCEPILYTCDETDQTALQAFPIRTYFKGIYGKSPVAIRGVRFFVGATRVFYDIMRLRIPIVHLHFFHVGLIQLCLVAVCRILGRTVVITVHDVEPFATKRQKPALARRTYGLAHALVVHNQTSRRELMEQLGIPEGRMTIVPHGNYLHYAAHIPPSTEARSHLGWPEESFVLLFFGQIKRVKGLDLLLNALPQIIAQHPHVNLVIAGKESDVPFAEYQKIIDDNSLRNNCTCRIHYIPNEEVPYYYGGADLVVLPYRRIYQSGAVLMAMSFGAPVLVSDIPGMKEMVHDDETGFMFQDGDVADLSRRIYEIIADPKKRKTVSNNARHLMEDSYAWEDIGKRTASLYDTLAQ